MQNRISISPGAARYFLAFVVVIVFLLTTRPASARPPVGCFECIGWYIQNVPTNNGLCCLHPPYGQCNITVCKGDTIQFYTSNQVYNLTWVCPGSSGLPSGIDYASDYNFAYFNNPGTYTLTVTVADSAFAGCYGTSVNIGINVVDVPQITYSISDASPCIGDTVCITTSITGENDPNATSPASATIVVDYGDGTSVANYGTSPIYSGSDCHVYTDTGTYYLSIMMVGCDTVYYKDTIHIGPPVPDFTVVPGCGMHFFDTSSCQNGIVDWFWNFGNPSTLADTSHLQNPSYFYPLPSKTYTVTLTITDTAGHIYSVQQAITTPPLPNATISGAAANNCGNGVMTYTAPCDSNVVYTWYVDNGTGTITDKCEIEVDWDPAGGYIVLYAIDTITDCSSFDTVFIPECCSGGVNLNNRTASSVLTDPAFVGYVTGTEFKYNNQLAINGVFTVDTTFTFNRCTQILMGGNAQIQVLAGETLSIDSSAFDKKCQIMWDGIYLNGVTAVLNITGASKIRYAKNAVVSISGGQYHVDNSFFDACVRGIVVKPYGGTHNSHVQNTTFHMNNSFLTAVPPLAWGVTRTIWAVEITDNADIEIGEPTQGMNTYDSLFGGVHSLNSRTKVYNSRFNAMLRSIPVSANSTGIAVLSEGAKNLVYTPKITVGGIGANEANTMINVWKGVEARDRQDVDVQKNSIEKVQTGGFGIIASRMPLRNVTINYNTINNQFSGAGLFGTGILVAEAYDATVTIRDNKIFQYNGASVQGGVGIRVALAQSGKVYLNILDNRTMRFVRTGIWLQNIDAKNVAHVNRNRVLFQSGKTYYQATGPLHFGIRLENCVGIHVDENLIERGINSTPNANIWVLADSTKIRRLRGISFENSPGSVVSENELRDMGEGVYGYAVSSASVLPCNVFNRCYNGFNFSGPSQMVFSADIGDQILHPSNGNPAPTGNDWNSTVNFDLEGIIASPPGVHWYHDGVNIPTDGTQAGSFALPAAAPEYSGNSTLCDSAYFLAPLPNDTIARDLEIGRVIRALWQDTTASDERVYYTLKYAHRKLKQNPSWLSLGLADDTLYQQVWDTTEPYNHGQFREAEEFAALTERDSFILANSAVSSALAYETNAQDVNAIYADSWMLEQLEFSSADSATLYTIAIQEPVAGGPGVYYARAMLGLSVDDLTGVDNSRKGRPEPQTVTAPDVFRLFPNPANDLVTVQYALGENETGALEIFDLSGRLIVTKTLAAADNRAEINVTGLQAGAYMVRLLVSGEAREAARLVIIK